MFTLIIDTSTEKSLIIFAEGKKVLLTLLFPEGAKSSNFLMPTLDAGLKQLGCSPASLQAIAVGIGPGSYTGMRVGVAAASGLAFPRNLPLIGFCSLEGFIAPQEGPFASLIDARIGGAYVLLQERQGHLIKHHAVPQLVIKKNLPDYLSDYPTVVGPHTQYPDPDHLAGLMARKIGEGGYKKLELLYLGAPHY